MIKFEAIQSAQSSFNIKTNRMINFCGNSSMQKDTFEKQAPTKNVEKMSYEFYKHLSKKMAYALRHKPQECNLTIDKEGYVHVKELLNYLNSNGHFDNINLEDIKNCIDTIEKKRFELIDDKKIRAYYGHSCKDKIIKEESIPPELLYHGTSRAVKDKILKEGLTKQNRQYVHLSTDVKTANSVGKRKDDQPIILKIDAKRAAQDGIKFYLGNQNVWLTDYLPPEYIKE